MALMCHGHVDFATIERRHGLSMQRDFAREIERLLPLVDDGLAIVADDAIHVTAQGWYVVRAVAMVFDRHLGDAAARARFSRVA